MSLGDVVVTHLGPDARTVSSLSQISAEILLKSEIFVSAEILLKLVAVGRQFTVQNPSELYVLVSSALPTTHRDMTCTVLKAT